MSGVRQAAGEGRLETDKAIEALMAAKGVAPYVSELTEKFWVPADAALGRAETLYLDHRSKMGRK